MQNIIFISIGIVVALVFFFSISVIHLRSQRDIINNKWYNLNDKLQYRQDLMPLLIELVRKNAGEKAMEFEKLVEQTVAVRARAAKNSKPGIEKVVVEHDLSRHLKEIMQFCELHNVVRINTSYLDIKKELIDLKEELEKISKDYNDVVRHHNNVIGRPYNLLSAALLGYKKKKIFEFE